jgi:hypothetical protein
MKRNFWTMPWRAAVFALTATSIASLLVEFYNLCPMRQFTFFVFVPALVALAVITAVDVVGGDGQLTRAVMIGLMAGFAATVSYDIFRLPFVFAREWHLTWLVPHMDLYKVFPRFGAMILGEPAEQPHYSMTAQLVGWAYHFSNGLTFGVMYMAMLGNPAKHGWGWAVLMAAGLEAGMLFTPYPAVFGIPLTARFVEATLAAHVIFGIVMGLVAKRLSQRSRDG